ncbi:MAG TPA: hypothetical protein VMT20_27970 [Terriglobia bacterium]|nr:hypothetical protein [Terriglobia bacterium]
MGFLSGVQDEGVVVPDALHNELGFAVVSLDPAAHLDHIIRPKKLGSFFSAVPDARRDVARAISQEKVKVESSRPLGSDIPLFRHR